jgi:hypothetical protein
MANEALSRLAPTAIAAAVLFLAASFWVYLSRRRVQKPDLKVFEVTDGNVVGKLEEAHREARLPSHANWLLLTRHSAQMNHFYLPWPANR